MSSKHKRNSTWSKLCEEAISEEFNISHLPKLSLNSTVDRQKFEDETLFTKYTNKLTARRTKILLWEEMISFSLDSYLLFEVVDCITYTIYTNPPPMECRNKIK